MAETGRLQQFTAPKKLILYWRNHSGLSSDDESSSDAVKRALFKRYHDLKNRAWASILRSTQVTSRLSSAEQKRLEADFETVKSLEFTVPNIYGFLQGIIDQQGEIQLSMVCLVRGGAVRSRGQ
ncbi:hypothetical protein A1355_21970 [Methylomonas koyamae]|uniref:DUF4942 domain-containing protein n=1 Tax=Methylomonas koyamae TaxID=702114 RepID=A0A177NZC2_9GAMM|nr:hypothetical protein A1355_21970 [Methylomonas koyamae]